MPPPFRFRFPFVEIALLLSSGTVCAQHVNLNFTGADSWKAASTIPASATPFIFPDWVSRVPADFVFKGGSSSTWNLDQGASIICTQSGTAAYNRFFIGSGDGMHSRLTFSTRTLTAPGQLCARLSTVSAFRIGEAATSSRGTLRIEGGVRIQTGYIHGEGPSPAIEIARGRLDVFSSNTARHLNGIAIRLGPKGQLWLEDSGRVVTSATAFSTFVSGATISAPGGTLVFQTGTSSAPATGASATGTLITVNATADSDGDGLPDAWEIAAQLDPADNGSINPINGALGDPDADGSTNLAEYQRDTDPRFADTDGDGLLDGVETQTGSFVSTNNTGTHPRNADSDGDGLSDGDEVLHGTSPTNSADPGTDLDGDGLPNAWEITFGLDPYDNGSANPDNGANGDPDHDGLPNREELTLGSHPRINESGRAWQPRPARIGILVVATHPDDEGIFFGGTLPYYSQVKKVPTLLLSMTSGDNSLAPPVREAELRNAAWTYGLRYQPLFARFRDKPTTTLNDTWDVWADGVVDGIGIVEGRVKAARHVATVIRRYRPEVIASHDINGEYGHKNHMATCQAVIDAWSLASDPAIELDGLPPWQPKKLYIHKWQQNRLFHDFWETAYPELGGKTPRQVTDEGLDFHITQNKPNVSTAYLTGETSATWDPHPSEWWGLHSSRVPADPAVPDFTVNGTVYSSWAKGDFFRNIHLDLDDNGLPDEWEKLHSPLTGTLNPHSDSDGDGLDALTEYIVGTSPLTPDPAGVTIDLSARTARFLTRLPSGIGYEGRQRFYRLETSTTLLPGSWTPAWEGAADGGWKEIQLPAQASRQFYRLVTVLE